MSVLENKNKKQNKNKGISITMARFHRIYLIQSQSQCSIP